MRRITQRWIPPRRWLTITTAAFLLLPLAMPQAYAEIDLRHRAPAIGGPTSRHLGAAAGDCRRQDRRGARLPHRPRHPDLAYARLIDRDGRILASRGKRSADHVASASAEIIEGGILLGRVEIGYDSGLIDGTVAEARTAFVIAITTNIMPISREECLTAGMNAFLTKPIRLSTLEREIRAMDRTGGRRKRMKDPSRQNIVVALAYREALLAMKERGLTGSSAHEAALDAAAKVSTRMLNRPVTPDDIANATGL